MMNLWRFYAENIGVSGVVFAKNEEEATERTAYYLSIQFDDIRNVKEDMGICVWKCTNDDDYRDDYPFAIATSY